MGRLTSGQGWPWRPTIPIDTREETPEFASWLETRAKYRGKTQRRQVGTNHCKFLSSHPRVPDHGRDRALDGGRQEVQPLRPSGRDHDPDRLPPRLAGIRVVRSAMVAGRAGHRPATRPQGEERLVECPPDAGRRDTRAAASAARTGAILARLYDRAGRADDAQGLVWGFLS